MCQPHTWFLKIDSVQISVCGCVYPPPRLLITSDVIWTSYDWLIKFYTCYIAAVVIIDDGRGLWVETCRINQSNKSKLSLYKPLLIPFKQLYTSNKMECCSYKGGYSIHGSRRIKAFKRRAGLGLQVISNKTL